MFAKGKGGLQNGGSSKRRGHASSTRFRIRPWAVVAWVAAWQIASMLMSSALLLPGPADVLVRFFELAATSEFWMRVAFTLVRIAEGFARCSVCSVPPAPCASRAWASFSLLRWRL